MNRAIMDEKRLKIWKIAPQMLFEELLNGIMKCEQDKYLNEEGKGDNANGYYNRTLSLSVGRLNLKVPRVRYGMNFRPVILPGRWKRVDKEYEEFIIALLANNYSTAQIKRSCEQSGIVYSQEAMEDAIRLINERLDGFKNQYFNEEWLSVMIDAYHSKLREENGRIGEISLFCAVGINLEGEKKILGFWILKGRENKGFWVEVFQDLISRGINRVLLFVTDNFGGVKGVIKSLYPYSEHQLCYVHMMRNVIKNLSKRNRKVVINLMKMIKISRDEKEGGSYYDKVIRIMEEEKPEMARIYKELKENYLTFLKYPESVRKYIYTTNPVESINSGIERMRMNMGGYFPSERSLEVNLFIQLINLNDFWDKRYLSGVRESYYEIKQLFALRFEIKDNI